MNNQTYWFRSSPLPCMVDRCSSKSHQCCYKFHQTDRGWPKSHIHWCLQKQKTMYKSFLIFLYQRSYLIKSTGLSLADDVKLTNITMNTFPSFWTDTIEGSVAIVTCGTIHARISVLCTLIIIYNICKSFVL